MPKRAIPFGFGYAGSSQLELASPGLNRHFPCHRRALNRIQSIFDGEISSKRGV
jgi:hypothetical protein